MQLSKSKFYSTFFLFFFFLFSLSAQETFVPLFKNTTAQSRSDFATDQPDTKRVNYLELNLAARNGKLVLPKKMQFNLFPDANLEIELEKSEKQYYKNMEVYRGRSKDARFAHLPHYKDVIVVVNPNTGKMTAQIETNQGSFQISPSERTNIYEISEWENESIDCQNFHDRSTHQHESQASNRNSGCNERDADGKYVADLFIGYSYEASVRANDIDAHALSLVEMVNNGLTNSLVDNIYIRLVGTAISEHNPGVVTSVLGNVWTWFADEIALTGADYVASIQVPTGGPNEAGGWAGVGGYSSVNSINSAAAVFRHELGHNIGSSHCTPGILPYASGFSNGNVATHMCGNNINFYSTPLVNDAMGVPIGDAATADNGRVWKERASIVSARQKHTIVFDENDTGCGSSLSNGNYYIQNINSEMYMATANGSTARGTRLVQVADQATNNQWKFLDIGNGKYRILHTSSGRAIDLPNGSEEYTIWSLHGGSNQQFSIIELGTDTFNIIGNKGQCGQIRDASLVEGDTIIHLACDNSLNTKWRFIPVPDSDILDFSLTTTDVSCYGEENGAATATATGGTGNYTFTWSTGTTGTAINNLAPGNYSVTVDDGTTSFPHAFTIKQVAPFEVNLTKDQATDLNAANASATVVVTGGTEPYMYAWDNGNTTVTATNLSAGLHTIVITDANGCSLEKEFFIDCPDAFKLCDDGNPNTIGDHIDINCDCVGKVFTCDNGLAVSNVAIGKTAEQSSTNGAGIANRAIDGNRDGNFNAGSVAATNSVEGENAWWQVDLKEEVDITGILINNRTDCCTGRLEDYEVFISSTPFESDDRTTTRDQAGIVWSQEYQNATPLPDTLIEPNVTGRYVRIQSASDRPLALAEVGIFGCGVPTSQTITANPLGNNLYELKGFIINNGETITGATIEHGATDFGNINPIDITGINDSDTFYVHTTVDIGTATAYQFRIKFDSPTKSHYSNDFNFEVNSAYCTPTVDNELWYKEFRNVVLNNLTYNGNGDNYEDATDFSFGEFTMGSNYAIALTTPADWWHNLTFLVYVDLNNDGDFTDYNEIVGTSEPIDQTTNFEIIIPKEDVLVDRDLRMRILGHEGGAYTTCYSPIGNFKDFTIRIKADDCTGGGYLVPFYRDMDNDGYGGKDQEIARNCSINQVNGYVNTFGDCDDTNANINPNAAEICGDGIDNNCDGFIENENVLLGKSTKQSTTSSGGNADRAVDGNTSGDWGEGSITHTNTEENPYWEVDLGTTTTLESIVLWNRTNCCADRLSNFYVFISDEPFTSNDPIVTAGQAGIWSIFTENHPTESITFEANATGRYLRVQINGTGILSLAEVQAFASCTEATDCTFYADNDGDGYGDPNNSLTQADCNNAPQGYVANNQDFDDNERTAYNGAIEICDNIDNDGDQEIDEGADYDTHIMTFQSEVIPTEVYTASQTIETQQTVTVEANTDVHLVAGESITLEAGFSVAAGALFLAEINGACTSNFEEDEIATTSKTTTQEETILANELTELKTQKTDNIIDHQIRMKVYPNPFRGNTTIDFTLPKTSPITLQVFGINGQVVATLVDNMVYEAGIFKLNFSADSYMNGMYYFVLATSDKVLTEKVVVIGE